MSLNSFHQINEREALVMVESPELPNGKKGKCPITKGICVLRPTSKI